MEMKRAGTLNVSKNIYNINQAGISTCTRHTLWCSLLYHAAKFVSVKMSVSVATTTTENQLPP